MRKKALNLNGVSPFKAFIIDDAFSEQECDFLLHKVLAKDGFSAEQTNKYGEKWRDDALRNNSSAHIKCKKVAEFLYCRIASHLTGVFGGSIGLNKHLRYNAFQPKETIAPHVDGEFETNGNNGKEERVMSKLTFLLYLNTIDNGGETRFLNAETMKHTDVLPVRGRVLIFDQRICHAALPVKGRRTVKYTLRSDVLYRQQK